MKPTTKVIVRTTSEKLLGPVSISEKTSFRKISSSLEAARFVFRIVRSLWNLTGTSAAVLPMCLSNFKTIRQFKVPISWLRDFTRSYEKTSFRILRRGPGSCSYRDPPDASANNDLFTKEINPSLIKIQLQFSSTWVNSLSKIDHRSYLVDDADDFHVRWMLMRRHQGNGECHCSN